jgi:hypothetical protein
VLEEAVRRQGGLLPAVCRATFSALGTPPRFATMPAKAGQERTVHLNVAGRLHIELGDKLNTEGPLQDDYYWHLQVDDAFDMSREPASLAVGQLSDGLTHVREASDVEPETV